MSSESPKRALRSHVAAVAKALGHAHRLELLELLAERELGVDTLAGAARLTVGNASQHLQTLRRAGLVTYRRDGKHVRYRLADQSVVGLMTSLRDIAEQNLAEVRKVLDG